MIEPSTSPSLLCLAVDGDAAAWRRLVQIYGPLVYQWSRRLGLQPADAADAVQETLASVSRGLVNFDAGQPDSKFRGWLWTILKRRIADARRHGRRQELMGSAVAKLATDIDSRHPAESPGDDPPGDEDS